MPKSNETFTCCRCGKNLNVSQYYKSYSDFWYGGHLPICQTCFNTKYSEYMHSKDYLSSKKAMQRMCMIFDIYFDEEMFDSCDIDDETVIGKYFRLLNMNQNKGKTFDNTIKKGFYLSGDRKKIVEKKTTLVDEYGNESEEESKVSTKDVEKWGEGFEPVDYDVLNNHYKLLTSSNPQSDSNREIFIVDLCYTKMQQMKAVREGRVDDYQKLTDSYRKTFQQAGLKAIKDQTSLEDFTIGVNAETIEKYTPAEYYKNKQLYKDADNLGDYITRFLFRPLKNLMHGSKDRDSEFYVKDEDNSDGLSDDE